MNIEMFDVSYPIAFGAGLVSFFAPCVVPLLPVYVSYVTGVSLLELKRDGLVKYRGKIFWTSTFYILGFSLVFVALGVVAGGVGILLRQHSELIRRVGGVVIMVFGLQLGGYVNLSFLFKGRNVELPEWMGKLGYLRAAFVGVIFGITWTPCVGVVLGSILALAAVGGTAAYGASLLFVYSLGISLPFMIVSLGLVSATKYLKFIGARAEVLTKIAGIVLVVLGVLLLTDTYKYLNGWLFEMAYSLGY